MSRVNAILPRRTAFHATRIAGVLLFAFASLLAADDLRVYAIDVEGGKSTLYVSPTGESMLVDTGYGDYHNRDADRIVAAAKAAGVKQIDYLVITHYHGDHVGGVAQLAAKMPIRAFFDHGSIFGTVNRDAKAGYAAYVALRAKGPRTVVKPGDSIPIKGIQVEVVTAAGEAIVKALPGAGQPNPVCASYQALDPDPGENARSIGMLITYGEFPAGRSGRPLLEPGIRPGLPEQQARRGGCLHDYASRHQNVGIAADGGCAAPQSGDHE